MRVTLVQILMETQALGKLPFSFWMSALNKSFALPVLVEVQDFFVKHIFIYMQFKVLFEWGECHA